MTATRLKRSSFRSSRNLFEKYSFEKQLKKPRVAGLFGAASLRIDWGKSHPLYPRYRNGAILGSDFSTESLGS
jgi:hypothetical protein